MNKISLIIFFVFLLSNLLFAKKKLTDLESLSDSVDIRKHIEYLTNTEKYRNFANIEILNQTANYIFDELSSYCDTVYYQTYIVKNIEYKNVVGIIGLNKSESIVVGAHYDVCGDQHGADDNASGIAGILELSRLFSEKKIDKKVYIVAYCLEEPPYFRTENMGSYIHAKSLYDNNTEIKGMVCLDMIGYFSEEKKSQRFPVGILKLFYGNKGNFITVVQKFNNGKFGRQFKRKMKSQKLVRTKSLKAPAFVPGIDFSDHQNYWKFGYSALMITDTSFYRNNNYHEKSDTIETLNFKKMANVIDELYLTISKI